VVLTESDLPAGVFARLPNRFLMLRVSGRRGRRTLAKFTSAHGDLPATLIMRSIDGQADIHFFTIPPGQRVRSTKLGPGLVADYCVKVDPNISGHA
jgi:hypothetical protein